MLNLKYQRNRLYLKYRLLQINQQPLLYLKYQSYRMCLMCLKFETLLKLLPLQKYHLIHSYLKFLKC
jgi:hypothetical protein